MAPGILSSESDMKMAEILMEMATKVSNTRIEEESELEVVEILTHMCERILKFERPILKSEDPWVCWGCKKRRSDIDPGLATHPVESRCVWPVQRQFKGHCSVSNLSVQRSYANLHWVGIQRSTLSSLKSDRLLIRL